jgi:hypothetical protein
MKVLKQFSENYSAYYTSPCIGLLNKPLFNRKAHKKEGWIIIQPPEYIVNYELTEQVD